MVIDEGHMLQNLASIRYQHQSGQPATFYWNSLTKQSDRISQHRDLFSQHLAVDAVRSDERRVKRHLIQEVNTVKDVVI